MHITTQFSGAEQLPALARALNSRLRDRLDATLQSLALGLKAKVQNEALSGQLLKTRSGQLKASIYAKVEGQGSDCYTVTVGADTPYARIQELGGTTKAHLIEPRLKKALAFNGKVFARVHHPGSRIPAHYYLRDTLAAYAPTIKAELVKCLGSVLI